MNGAIRDEIVEKLQRYSNFVRRFAENGLLEAEEVELLKRFGII